MNLTEFPKVASVQQKFRDEILEGLQTHPKRLPSKYFYDQKGDQLFQQIMASPDYYLTRCELEIFKDQTAALARVITTGIESFDLIELGAGDATKSFYLLDYLTQQKQPFHYYPIDISGNILEVLQKDMERRIPELKLTCLEGEYFEMLQQAYSISSKRKVVLFLGSNIGNMPVAEAYEFCMQLQKQLQPGDIVLMGFDLKKRPEVILNAYDDKLGITARFNLNLLERINRELEGNFEIDGFEHYQMYDPESGACKSYLVSLAEQTVTVGGENISFAKDEWIYMEISQKYDLHQIEQMATASGFESLFSFFDNKKWFTDCIWQVK